MKNRHLEMLVYLLKVKKTTYQELAERFEVSTKTIERDMDRLSSVGIPVYCQQGGGGGVRIDESYKFSTSFFSPEDIQHMVTALHITQSVTANPQSSEVLNKLYLVSPTLTKMFEENVSRYLTIDLNESLVDFSEPVFESIKKCMDLAVYGVIDGVKSVCLSYVVRFDGVYLFVYQGAYKLLKISEIICIEVTDIEVVGVYDRYDKNTHY